MSGSNQQKAWSVKAMALALKSRAARGVRGGARAVSKRCVLSRAEALGLFGALAWWFEYFFVMCAGSVGGGFGMALSLVSLVGHGERQEVTLPWAALSLAFGVGVLALWLRAHPTPWTRWHWALFEAARHARDLAARSFNSNNLAAHEQLSQEGAQAVARHWLYALAAPLAALCLALAAPIWALVFATGWVLEVLGPSQWMAAWAWCSKKASATAQALTQEGLATREFAQKEKALLSKEASAASGEPRQAPRL
jgi:hypothetical protein